MKTLPLLAIAAALLTCAPATTLFAQAGPKTDDRTMASEDSAGARKSDTKSSRRREVDKSADTGTVPSRYRKDVPREYQKYIPWGK